jgi:hypothetical protein
VVHDSEGREVESQLLPIASASLNIRDKHVKAYLGTSPGAKPKFWLAFPVSVPPPQAEGVRGRHPPRAVERLGVGQVRALGGAAARLRARARAPAVLNFRRATIDPSRDRAPQK